MNSMVIKLETSFDFNTFEDQFKTVRTMMIMRAIAFTQCPLYDRSIMRLTAV